MLFFFYGAEAFQPEQKVRRLQEKFLTKNPTGGGLVSFECGDGCHISAIIQVLGEQNLFAQKKLIVIKNFFAHTHAEEQKTLRDALERGSSDDVIVVWEVGSPRKNAALFTWLCKNADTAKEYVPLKGSALSRWEQRRVEGCGGAIAHDAVQTLIAHSGSDLYALAQESDKLLAYAQERTITTEDVEKLVVGRTDANMFATVEALAAGNKAHALVQLRKQLYTGDDPHHIFSMYAYHVRTLLAVSGAYHKQGLADKGAIAKAVKMHPFVVQKALATVQRVPTKKLIAAHDALCAIDTAIKNGKRDMATALERFVMEF